MKVQPEMDPETRHEVKLAVKEYKKQSKKRRKAKATKEEWDQKAMVKKAIPNCNDRRRFYDMYKPPDQESVEEYLEQVRLMESALRVMVEYCTGEGSATGTHRDGETGAALDAKPWSNDRSRFAQRAPLREWELD